MLYTKTKLKTLLSELKAKVKEVEEDKNSLEKRFWKSREWVNKSSRGSRSRLWNRRSQIVNLPLWGWKKSYLAHRMWCWRSLILLQKMKKRHKRECLKAKDELYQEMQTAHEKELDTWDELICLLKEKLKRNKTDVYVDGDNVQSYWVCWRSH